MAQNSRNLCEAIRKGDEDEIKRLKGLIQRNEVNDFDESGFTALHLAVKFNRLSTAESLHRNGANLNLKTAHPPKFTPLHLAAKYNADKWIIGFLINEGADKDAEDEDSNTPFLTAVAHGQREAMDSLISNGCATNVKGRSAVFIAAEEDQSELLRDLINHRTKAGKFSSLLDTPDSFENTPLHIASTKGNIACVQVLLSKTTASLNARNKEKRTPLHLAAENGHILVVKELLRYRAIHVDIENHRFYTPLHFSCNFGHHHVAKVLLEAKADPNVKNARGWTPLDFAASVGCEKTVQVLIDFGAKSNTKDKKGSTPLIKACTSGHAKAASILIHNGASVSDKGSGGRNVLDIAIDEGHEDVAMAIVKTRKMKEALRNKTKDEDGNETTPMRKLIMKMPDATERVFKHCLARKQNDKGIVVEKYRYEFLDDFDDAGGAHNERWHPNVYKRSNHCLQILADSKSQGLLKHPLVTSLLEYKWKKYGEPMNWCFFGIYFFFIFFLTIFALTALPPGTSTCIAVRNGNSSREICDASDAHLYFVPVAGATIMIFSLILILIEGFQILALDLKWLKNDFNYLESFLFILNVLSILVLFFGSSIFAFIFAANCFCPTPWQWEIGTICLFLGYIRSLKYLKKLPIFGVYPFMFLNISKDFLKMAVLALVLILSFAFSFYMLFHDPSIASEIRTPFHNPGRAFVKTFTMATGEFEFDSIFRQDNTEGEDIQYPGASFLLWIAFIIILPILLTNLLVAVAVDIYTQGIREDAEIYELKYRVNLILSVEELLSYLLQRKLMEKKRMRLNIVGMRE